MRMVDIIKKKRDGMELSSEEISFVVDSYMEGEIPDYQMSALLMAVFYKGMSKDEIIYLTKLMAYTGSKIDLSNIKGFKVDKHSTGGVGDKTSLIVAPLAASCGIKIAKISGRGLGHTGGTVDKLESIPGYKTSLPVDEFESIVNDVGVSIIGQNTNVAPIDKKLYALRDVTATVDSLPLIATSVMSKKLAASDDGIVLEVTIGSGAFNKTFEQGENLAKIMVDIGNAADKRTVAVLTDMNQPLGKTIGNSLEVIEAINVLKNGKGDKRLVDLSLSLTAAMLSIAGKGDMDACRELAETKLKNGDAYKKLKEMVKRHEGDVSFIEDTDKFYLGFTKKVLAPKDGYIEKINTEGYGLASLYLGAGRNTMEDKIDFSAGIEVVKSIGDEVKVGDTIAILHSSNKDLFEQAENKVLESIQIGDIKINPNPVVLGYIE